MASLRNMTRKNGTAYVQVPYRLNGKQTATSFEDSASAAKFRDLVDAVAPVKALASVAADPALSTMTVELWVVFLGDRLLWYRCSLRASCRRLTDSISP